MLVPVLAVAASTAFLVRLLPQPAKLWRSGVADGVSPMAAYNTVLSTLAWLAYGLAQGLFAVWSVSLLALVPGVWQAALLVRRTRRVDVAGAGAFAALMVVAALGGWFPAVLAISVVITAGPQVVEVLRGRELGGVAPATWWIALADAALWGAYGAAVSDAALVGYWAVLSVCAGVVLARLAWARRAALEPAAA